MLPNDDRKTEKGTRYTMKVNKRRSNWRTVGGAVISGAAGGAVLGSFGGPVVSAIGATVGGVGAGWLENERSHRRRPVR